MHNDVNDRIILSTESGAMMCLHEPSSKRPRLNRPAISAVAEEDKAAKKQPGAVEEMTQPAADGSVEDPFGSPAPMTNADGAGSADDPFGAPPSGDAMKKSDDPFSGF
jgi:hypothetical protein